MTKKEYEIVKFTIATLKQKTINDFDDMLHELDALLEVEELEEDKF